MGHREDLLEAAQRLLVEKGFAHITARDLVTASNTNLASIGYHFGSKDGLLNAAVIESFNTWDDELNLAIDAAGSDNPIDRLTAFLGALTQVFQRNQGMIIASAEAFSRAPHVPEVREQLARVYASSRAEIAGTILGVDPDDIDAATAHHLGSLGLAVINGLALQWVIDPENAPTGEHIGHALRVLAGGLQPGGAAEGVESPEATPRG